MLTVLSVNQLSVRYKLTLLVLLVLFPPLLLNIWQTNIRYRHDTEDALQDSEDLVSAVGLAFQNYIDKVWDVENALGQAIFLGQHPLSIAAAESLLQNQLAAHPTVEHMAWIDPSGKVVAATAGHTHTVDIGDRDHFKKILKGADSVVSNLIIARITGNVTFTILRAIRDKERKLLGVISTGVDLGNLASVLPATSRGYYTIVDSRGIIVYSSSHGSTVRRMLRGDQPAILAIKQQESIRLPRFVRQSSNNPQLGAAAYLGKVGWAVSSILPLHDALDSAIRETRHDALVLGFGGLAAVLLGLVMSQLLLKPVYALQKAAQALSEGDLSARTGLQTGTDELSKTAQAFDHMAEYIEKLEQIRTKMMQTAAHELRNPMAGAKGVLGLIPRRLDQNRPAQQVKDLVSIAEREVDRATTVLNDFVDAFRVQSGRFDAVMQPVDFLEIVNEALEPFRVRAADIGLGYSLVLENSCSSYIISGDRHRLVQVVHNLVSNAVKYTPNGGTIHIALQSDADNVLLKIKDQGVGIPQGDLPHIFQSFFRASNVKVGGPGGVGLGLFICKDIIESHGGRIWVESQEGHGSTFWVELPRKSANATVAHVVS